MHPGRRFFLVIGASLLWALLVASAFYRLAGAGARAKKTQPEKPLVVAVRELPLGTTLTRDAVKLRNVPENLLPKGGFSRIEDVLDRPVISAIQTDEPVIEPRIAARGSGVGLAPLISPGMRAISVRVNDVVGVAGFILPGMHVDVLVTGRPSGASDTFTRTVLQNITVLSAGQTIQTDGKSQTITTPVVTLLVNPSEAEALTLANNEGHIQLVLRNSVDRQIASTPGRQLHELLGSPAADGAPQIRVAPAPANRAARSAERKPEIVRAVEIRPTQAGSAASTTAEIKTGTLPAKQDTVQVTVIRGSAKAVEAVLRKGAEEK
jgi:pilus assembly protein CpaB